LVQAFGYGWLLQVGAIGIIVGLLVGKWRCEQSAGIGISTQGLTLKLFVKLCPHRLNFFYFQGGIRYSNKKKSWQSKLIKVLLYFTLLKYNKKGCRVRPISFF